MITIHRDSKIVLIRPRGHDDGNMTMPFGIVSIARYLKTKNINASIVDFYNPLSREEDLLEQLRGSAIEYVGISAMTTQAAHGEQLIEMIRRALPRIKCILGGIHYTVMPEAGTPYGQVVKGPGEIAVYNIVTGQIPLSQAVVQGEALDDYSFNPFPDEDMFDTVILNTPGERVALMTSRGCPFACKFCLSTQQRSRRIGYYPIKDVMDFLALVYRKTGIQEFFLEDDVFFLNKKRVSDFCAACEKLPFKPSFYAFTHVSINDRELYTMAHQAGFRLIYIGIESGNDTILKTIGKNFTCSAAEHTVATIVESGLDIRCLYMLANMGETAREINDTIRFAHRLHKKYRTRCWFSIAQPLPGTEFKELAHHYGSCVHGTDAHVANNVVTFIPHGMTEKQIYRLHSKALLFGNNGTIHAWFWYSGVYVKSLLRRIVNLLHRHRDHSET